VLKVDHLVAVRGTVKVRAADSGGGQAGVPQIWADRVMDFKDSTRYLKGAVIEVQEHDFDDVMQLKLKERLRAHPGTGLVRVKLVAKDGSDRVFRLDEARAELNNALIAELRAVFGPDSVRLWGELPSCEDDNRHRRPPAASR
jgi:hypothetical protein